MASVLTVIAVVIVLLLLNALFVAAEFGIVGAPRVAIERKAAQGDRTARRVAEVLTDPVRQDRYIATAQLGITVASLGLGMYGEHHVAEWIAEGLHAAGMENGRWVTAHALASVLAVAILTYFHIVVGEMIPKSLALAQAARTALWVTPPMLAIQALVFPLVVGLNAIGNGVLRLFGIRRSEHASEHYRTPEELQYIVRESQAGGMLRREQADVVQELLEFGDLTAAEVMVPRVRVVGVPVGASFEEVTRIVREHPHTRYPIFEGSLDHIVGMVHIKDLFRRLRSRRSVHLNDARPVPYLPETVGIDALLKAMRAARTQMAVILDEHGGTAGIVTIEDLFEEVVGEIEEGSGVHRPDVFRDESGRVVAEGTVRLDEVGDFLGVVLEHPEVDTVSGLVLTLLGRPPVVGDAVEYDDVRFEVTAVEGHGVRECVVTLLKPPVTTRPPEGGEGNQH